MNITLVVIYANGNHAFHDAMCTCAAKGPEEIALTRKGQWMIQTLRDLKLVRWIQKAADDSGEGGLMNQTRMECSHGW